jgi:Amt family ammonium transporter
MPLFGLGVLILWLGWFGFNPGSTLGAMDGRFPEVALVTMLAAGAGVLARSPPRTGRPARSTSAWPATARSVPWSPSRRRRATSSRGPLRSSASIAGIIVPLGCLRDRQEDRRSGRRADRHGLCGVWGTLACGIFTSPRLAAYNAVGEPGLIYTARSTSSGTQALGIVTVFAFVFALSYARSARSRRRRPARDGRRGGRRTGHLRARHVRVSGAVHPGARAHRLQPRARQRAGA